MEKPEMNLTNQDGNIFSVLGKASTILQRNGLKEQEQEMTRTVFEAENYDEALAIIGDYVEFTFE